MKIKKYITIKTCSVKRIPGPITTFSQYNCTIEVGYRKGVTGSFAFKTLNGHICDIFKNKNITTFEELIRIIESEQS